MFVGVVGLGSIGRRHVGTLLAMGCHVFGFDEDSRTYARAKAEHPDLNLNAHAFTSRLDATPYLDAVVIATPWNMHVEWVEWATARDIPFFVEKPLGSVEQLPRWRALAERTLPINQVGYMLRFHPIAQRMQEFGALGGTFRVQCNMASWPGRSYGPMLFEMSHEIDLALWCGAPPVVTHVQETGPRLSVGMGIGWSVLLDSKADHYYRDWSVYQRMFGYQYAFDSPQALGEQMYVDELAHFLQCVRSQTPTRVPLSEGLKVLEVCRQVEERCQAVAS